jgi:hypothetical protein
MSDSPVRWWTLLVVPGMLAFPIPAGLQAQRGAGSVDAPGISVGEVTASPGATVMVPLHYVPEPGVAVSALTIDIVYVDAAVTFDGASSGIASDGPRVEVKTNLSDGPPDEKGVPRARLRVTLAVRDDQPSKELPRGVLAYVAFAIAATRVESAPIPLRLSVVSANGPPGRRQPAPNVNARSGVLVVGSPGDLIPPMACFFYMH